MSLDYASLLGDEAESLLNHKAVVPSSSLHLPGPDHFDSVWGPSDRSPQVLRSLQALHGHGRLANTGYLSILPVDQGIEHAAGASFAKNPEYFDGENIVKLAIEGGCNAVATTFGALSGLSRKYAHRIPFIVKINHNELLTMPNQFDQVMFGSVRELGTWVQSQLVPRSTSAPINLVVKSSKSPKLSKRHENSEWPPSCGATFGRPCSRRMGSTIMCPLT